MIKTILLPTQEKKANKRDTRDTKDTKEKKNRKITLEKRWKHSEQLISSVVHPQDVLGRLLQGLTALQQGGADPDADPDPHPKMTKLVLSQIMQKWTSYRFQDVEKKLWQQSKFITPVEIVKLLLESDLKCHYCKREMLLLYEQVREPLQWSLDRIDNEEGHNRGNLCVACLNCNLRRKTIHHDRYFFTKNVVWKKVENTEEDNKINNEI